MRAGQAGKRQMAGDKSKNSKPPDWYADGIDHIWLPYAQMKTARAAAAGGAHAMAARIVLADGRELIDGIASLVDRLPRL